MAVKVNIRFGDKVLHIFNAHLVHTHQKESAVQNEQAENLIKIIPSELAVVMGDFNATPDSTPIRQMKKIMIDSDPASTPTLNAPLFDCPDCDAQTIPKIRLDYIFTSQDIKARSFKVHGAAGSDHLPISAIIDLG